jgi:hypothetical protein
MNGAMGRIVYLAFPTRAVSGGHKMTLRHVETLRELGFEAVVWGNDSAVLAEWVEHRAPVEIGARFRPDDVLVVPNDAPNALASLALAPQRVVVFCQNQFTLASLGMEPLQAYPAERFPAFIAVGPTAARTVRRLYPSAPLVLVPCFADERRFRPGAKRPAVAYSPRKRPLEGRSIRNLFRHLHPAHAQLPWLGLEGAHESQVAQTFAEATLFLSLSRLESVGITPLEAMASGCLCAGFTGIGGRDFAAAENGFWVDEDDCEAAADALAKAADLAASGGPALTAMIDAGRATAEAWSYARFRRALEESWMGLAPDARRQAGPLD